MPGSFKLLLLIVLVIILDIYPPVPLPGKSFTIRPDELTEKIHIDLQQLLGIPWVIQSSPHPQKTVSRSFLLHPDQGWVLLNEYATSGQMWKYDKGKWNPVSELMDKKPNCLFAIDSCRVWFSIGYKYFYKMDLAYLNGTKYAEIRTPNADGISDLYFLSSTNGWAACHWGQILRYDGHSWVLEKCPTPYHVEQLLMLNDSLGYARAGHHKGYILHYDGTWKVAFEFPREIGEIFMLDGHIACWWEQGLILFREKRWQKVDLTCNQSDTLLFNFPCRREALVWASTRGPAKSIGRHVQRVDFVSADDHDVVNIFCTEQLIQKNNWGYYTFYLFSKQQLVRQIVLKTVVSEGENKIREQFLAQREDGSSNERGICVADFNGDGIEDLYIVVEGNPNKLLLAVKDRPPGSHYWTEEAEKAGVIGPTIQDDTRISYDFGASSSDIDNDGDQDLLLTSLYGSNLLFKQIKPCRFREMSEWLRLKCDFGRTNMGIWGDVNNDGAVDLFVCNTDSSNHLYLNNGAGVFDEVTRQAGLYLERGGSCCAFSDIDNDNDLDLFVGRSGDRNLLYRNEGTSEKGIPGYEEIGNLCGVSGSDTLVKSTSCFFADVDNDGDQDLFVTNLICSNWLYLNDGRGLFEDVTLTSGIEDSALSQASVYFDADHDGDIDIMVGNRGENFYYENQGRARFIRRVIMSVSPYNGYTTGMAISDTDQDGDLDLYMSDANETSTLVRNYSETGHFISIVLKGTHSNRDAIGAKVFLYDFGHVGEQDHFCAMREVHGGYGSNSMSSRLVHFGIPDGEKKDIRILFPSGIRRTLSGVDPGQTLTIYETDGLKRRLAYFKKWLQRNIYYTPYHKEYIFLLSFLILIITSNLILQRQSWWSRRHSLWSTGITFCLVVGLFLILVETGFYVRHVLPVIAGISVVISGYYYAYKVNEQVLSTFEYSEKLFFTTNAFFHGEWGAKILHRIILYCTNLTTNRDPDDEIREGVESVVNHFFKTVLAELERIIHYSRSVGVASQLSPQVKTNMLAAVDALNRLKTAIHTTAKLDIKIPAEVVDRIQTLQMNLSLLRNIVSNYFTCRPEEVVRNVVSDGRHKSIKLEVMESCDKNTLVRIRSAELSQIVDNLITNAQRAIKQLRDGHIQITLTANADFVFLRVADNGSGIPPEIRKKLFSEQLPSRRGGEGFGLYYSKQLLTKYGGDIQLIKPDHPWKTAFEIQLKRSDNG